LKLFHVLFTDSTVSTHQLNCFSWFDTPPPPPGFAYVALRRTD